MRDAARPWSKRLSKLAAEKGELLSLQRHQVRLGDRPEVVLPAQKTETNCDRRIPISRRLKGILAIRRTDPDGEELPADAYVFGNEVGRVTTVQTRLGAAVLRARAEPEYVVKAETKPDGKTRKRFTAVLAAASREQLRAINLQFHDLRRQAGSRWLGGGVPLHTARDWLGHANIAETRTYLESTFAGQHEAMRTFEAKRGVQQSATGDENQGRKVPAADTNTNTNAPEITGKHH